MSWSRIAFAGLFMLSGGYRKSHASGSATSPSHSASATPRQVVKPLPNVEVDEVAAPPQSMVTFKRLMNIEQVCKDAYGNSFMKYPLLAYNGMEEERIPLNAEVKTPSIARMFQDAGADERYQPVFNVLGKVVADYHEVLPSYLDQRKAVPSGGRLDLNGETRAKLLELADTLSSACAALGKVDPPHQVPTKAIGQWRQAANSLRELSNGVMDENGYDSYMVEQQLGRGLGNAMLWVKAGHH